MNCSEDCQADGLQYEDEQEQFASVNSFQVGRILRLVCATRLTSKESAAVRMHCLGDRTFDAIAKVEGVCRERIRQRYESGLRKLRQYAKGFER